MKKLILSVFIVASFSLISPNKTQAVDQGSQIDPIDCYCNFWGKCKDSGNRSRCATGDPNVFCTNYNKNC